ncbi:MAG: hypothetical protein WBM44_00475 [Waterburya sp.]
MANKSDRQKLPLQEFLKEALDHYGIKGRELAKACGASVVNISNVRNSAVFPQTDKFWQIVQTADQMKPGVKRYLGNLIASNRTEEDLNSLINNLDLEQFVSCLSPDKKAQILFAIANDINKKPEKPETPIIQQETEKKLVVSC